MTRPIRQTNGRFCRSEDGSISVFMVLTFTICVAIIGLAIDVSNLFRQKEQLVLAADAAAQAAIVALSEKKSTTEVQQAAIAAAQTNAPTSKVGTVMRGVEDVELVRYDPPTRTIVSGTPNAVRVTLRRDDLVANPVQTAFLRLVGFDDFTFTVSSVAFYGQPGRCTSSDGIYAKGQVTLTSGNLIGKSYCVHSQTAVWLPQQNTFESGAGVSMPSLALCKGKCVNSSNPGIEQAVYEMNLPLTNVATHINTVIADLKASSSTLKTQFFANKPLATNRKPLVDAKIMNTGQANALRQGSVVTLTPMQFNDLMFNTSGAIPTGLTYEVDCKNNGNGTATSISIGTTTNRKNSSLTTTTPETLRNVAVISDCAIDIGDNARIDNALIVTTRVSSSSVLNASEGAVVGDPLKNCDLSRKVYFLAMSGISVSSNFTASNVAIVVNGNINVAASSSSSQVTHKGTSLHAEGSIQIPANHTFYPCAEDPSGLIPGVRNFKFVIPRA